MPLEIPYCSSSFTSTYHLSIHLVTKAFSFIRSFNLNRHSMAPQLYPQPPKTSQQSIHAHELTFRLQFLESVHGTAQVQLIQMDNATLSMLFFNLRYVTSSKTLNAATRRCEISVPK